jgi:hypothetical protein
MAGAACSAWVGAGAPAVGAGAAVAVGGRMSCLPRLAVVTSAMFLVLAAAGCESTIIDSEGVGDDGFEDGADDDAGGDGSGDGADDGSGDGADDGSGDGADDDGSSTGSGVSGSTPSCDAAPVPDASACDGSVSPLQLDQAEATTAIVGRWLRCNPENGGLFVTGAVFFADGRATRLHEESGDLVCREGFDEGGAWTVEDKCGIGLCDEYSMQITWDDGSFSPMTLLFGNDGDVLRIVNGSGSDEDFIRIP